MAQFFILYPLVDKDGVVIQSHVVNTAQEVTTYVTKTLNENKQLFPKDITVIQGVAHTLKQHIYYSI